MRDIRVVLFASEFPPQPGGIGNHAWNLAKELHRRGARVSVVVDNRSRDGEPERKFDTEAPFRISRNPVSVRGIRQIRRILAFAREIRRKQPDVVLASGRFPLLIASLYSGGGKKVVILHGTEAGAADSLFRRVVFWALSRFEVVIPVSRFTASYFERDSGDRRVTIIPNGVDREKFLALAGGRGSEAGLGGKPALLTVGNVTERKGQANVIRAMPLILEAHPGAVYHIVGIPTMRRQFEQLASRLGVAEHVVFHGAVSDEALVTALASADVFLMLSDVTAGGDVEGFGIAILEANCLGVPAIGSRGCGIEDAIDDDVTGLLVQASDGGAVARAVSRILERRERYSEEANAWALRHSWERIGERYERALTGGNEAPA